jgi:hypothetical protein
MATVSETGPIIAMGSAKAQVLKVKPVYELELARATRARDEATQRMPNILAHPVPHQGDPASSSFVSESRLGCFLHRPYMGWHLAIWVFYADYPGKKRETTWSGFDRGGGALAPV